MGQHQNTGGGAIHEPFGIIITPFGSNGLTTPGFTRHSGPNCGPIVMFGKQKDPPSPNGLPFLWVVYQGIFLVPAPGGKAYIPSGGGNIYLVYAWYIPLSLG